MYNPIIGLKSQMAANVVVEKISNFAMANSFPEPVSKACLTSYIHLTAHPLHYYLTKKDPDSNTKCFGCFHVNVSLLSIVVCY